MGSFRSPMRSSSERGCNPPRPRAAGQVDDSAPVPAKPLEVPQLNQQPLNLRRRSGRARLNRGAVDGAEPRRASLSRLQAGSELARPMPEAFQDGSYRLAGLSADSQLIHSAVEEQLTTFLGGCLGQLPGQWPQ